MRSDQTTITVRVPTDLDAAIEQRVTQLGQKKQAWIIRALMRALPKKKESAK